MPIIMLSSEDRDHIARILRGRSDILPRTVELFEKAPSKHTIRIVVRGSVVEHVERMPMGFNYEVQGFDKCSECGEVEPLCNWCKEARDEL